MNHPPLLISFMKLVDMELEMRRFALIDPVMGTPIFIREKIVKLKRSLLDGARVTVLRNSLAKDVDKRDKFLFPMEKTVPPAYGEQGE